MCFIFPGPMSILCERVRETQRSSGSTCDTYTGSTQKSMCESYLVTIVTKLLIHIICINCEQKRSISTKKRRRRSQISSEGVDLTHEEARKFLRNIILSNVIHLY